MIFQRRLKNPPGSLALGGFRVARIERILVRFAYPHTHTIQPQQQLQQQVRFVLGVIVMANLVFLHLT
jgi:hypothetical protein